MFRYIYTGVRKMKIQIKKESRYMGNINRHRHIGVY